MLFSCGEAVPHTKAASNRTQQVCSKPFRALFDKNGELLQTALLASGCGSDVGYHCKEVVVYDGKNQFITTKSEMQYEIDQTGNPNKKVAFESNSRIRFTVNEQQLSIDTLQHAKNQN
jgi:hypothetical protein